VVHFASAIYTVADITRHTYRDGDARYVVTFERQKTILQAIFAEREPFIKRLIASLFQHRRGLYCG
jgi:hypothetical protein